MDETKNNPETLETTSVPEEAAAEKEAETVELTENVTENVTLPEPDVAVPEVETAVPEVETAVPEVVETKEPVVLGAPGSVSKDPVQPDDLSSIVADAVRYGMNCTVVVQKESDVKRVYELLGTHQDSFSVQVRLNPNLKSRATWRRTVG